MQIFSKLKFQKVICALILFCVSINSASPTLLSLVPTVQAQVIENNQLEPGGNLISNVLNVFGNTGEILPKFDTKEAAEEFKNQVDGPEFDLVAILVEENLFNNNGNYDGLRSKHNPGIEALLQNDSSQAFRLLNEATISARIERYARDIQGISQGSKGLPFTKTTIIKVPSGADTAEVSMALEKLYLEGDGTLTEKNRLAGVVIIGNVPLPVVNKNGNKFVSVFPYTDFVNPYYVFDQSSGDFVISAGVDSPGAEVWHGIIQPPVGGAEGNQLLAEYLDKNHLFKIGESDYTDFAKKIFYSDLLKEFNLMNLDGLPAYQQYLKYWEDISYFRYNKHWAKKLYEDMGSGVPEGDGFDNDGDGKVDEDTINGYDDDGDGEAGSPLHGLVNSLDDDGDGEVDNDEEGVWGFCSPIPAEGPTSVENCINPGMPYKTGNFYNTKAGSFYKVTDGVDNDNNGLIDEGIDEDQGDAFVGIDNDRDGRVDEDTSADNDKDLDGKIDEDGPGDMNGDGCPGECDVDEDNDSLDGDSDFWPRGYEVDMGDLSLSITSLGNLIDLAGDIAGSGLDPDAIIDAFNEAFPPEPTDPEDFFSFPFIELELPIGTIWVPRIFPFPVGSDWVDEGSVNDDDEDGVVDEDGTDDNDNDKDGSFDEDPADPIKDIAGDLDIEDSLPDIRSKEVIDGFLRQYNDLFDRFFAEINEWAMGTGRYDTNYKDSEGKNKTDLTTLPFLIAAKDEFSRIYLKAVNDAVEKRVDDYVQKLQYQIDLIKGATLSGYAVLPDGNGVFPDNTKISLPEIPFINFGYQNSTFESQAYAAIIQSFIFPNQAEQLKEQVLENAAGPIFPLTPLFINGTPLDKISNIAQCSLYRGSISGEENSQMVYANTVFDSQSNLNKELPPEIPEAWSFLPQEILIGTEDNDYEGLLWQWSNVPGQPMYEYLKKQRELNNAYAGCFSENALKPERCFPYIATRLIFSLGGTKEVTNVPETATNHSACFDLKEKSGFDDYMYEVRDYLFKIGISSNAYEKAQYDSEIPPQEAAYRRPSEIKLVNFLAAPPATTETAAPSENGPEDATTAPIDIALLTAAIVDPNLSQLDVSLEDVLVKFLAGDRKDNNGNNVVDDQGEGNISFFAIDQQTGQVNWQQVGEQLLSRERKFEDAAANQDKPFKYLNNIIPGLKELVLRVEILPGKKVDTLVYHKEPTVDTVLAQNYELARDANGEFIEDQTLSASEREKYGKYVRAPKVDSNGDPVFNDLNGNGVKDANEEYVYVRTGNAISIPIDKPRYVSFMDNEGDYQKIYYPNTYRVANVEEYRQQLATLEQQLAAIQINPDYNGPAENININGYLTGVLDQGGLSEDTMTGGKIQTVASQKLNDALAWKDFDLDQKHDYALRHYLGSGLNPFTPLSDSERGYEVLYLNSSGSSDGLTMKFNKQIPGEQVLPEKSPIDCSLPGAEEIPVCQIEEPTEGVDGGDQPAGEEDEFEAVIIFEWFQALQEWAEKTQESLSMDNTVSACPATNLEDVDGDEETASAEDLIEQDIINTPVDLDGNGVPDGSENTVRLNLRLEDLEKNVLRTGQNDQTALIVEAIDANGNVNTADNYTEVTLKFESINSTLPILKFVGQERLTLGGGRARFIVASTENSGTATATAVAVSNAAVRSDGVKIISTAENIRLSAFRRYTNYELLAGGEAGYGIYDENGNQIADIDAVTGYITLLSDDYFIKVLPSLADKPLRQAVAKVGSEEVVAILYFVTAEANGINFDAANVDYATRFADLKGVRLKDLRANDTYSFQTISGTEAFAGKVYLKNSASTDNFGKVGLVDETGNVFISGGLTMTVRPQAGVNKPVVWVIKDAGNNELFEIYLGAEFEVITKLERAEVENLFVAALVGGGKIIAGLPEMKEKISVAVSELPTKLPSEWKIDLLKIAHAQSTLPDSDGDGLNNLEEVLMGSNPFEADSNLDGIDDFESLNLGIDPVVTPNEALFSDLKPGAEAYSEIVKLYRRGLLVVEGDGRVRPKDPITREEFIKLDLGGICVICDRFNENTKRAVWAFYSLNPFPDTNISENLKYCVAEGKNRGIISGYAAFENEGFYVPEANISRAEASKVILETARQQIQSFPAFVQEDLNGKPWYYNYVLTAQREKIYPRGKILQIDQMNETQFKAFFDSEINNPNSQLMAWLAQPITRAEFAIMVARFIDRYDCFNNDADGDGLPDNYERYIYATSSLSKDTDKGGVNDDVEVFRGTNPLDPSDDIIKPVEPEIDLNADPDTDGLTTGYEQTTSKTNPFDNDTDDGGVNDGDEVLRGSDPLDTGDDLRFFEADEGAYVAGEGVRAKTVYSIPDGQLENEAAINTEEVDSVPADGESFIYIGATLYDAEGNIKKDDNTSIVRFGFRNSTDSTFARLEPLNVRVTNGYAETRLISKTKTGLPTVIAAVDGENWPSDEKIIDVHALEPARISLTVDSPIIPSGGLSNTLVKATMRDRNGNLTNNGVYQIDFNTETQVAGSTGAGDVISLDSAIDEDPEKPGIQVSSVTGKFELKATSGQIPETSAIVASYQSELATTQTVSANFAEEIINPGSQVFLPAAIAGESLLQTRDDLNIRITPNKQNLRSDGTDSLTMQAEVVDIFGQRIDGFEGVLTMKIFNKDLAGFADSAGVTTDGRGIAKQFVLVDGEAEIRVDSTTRAGMVEMMAQVNGIAPKNIKVRSQAVKATQIILESDQDIYKADPNEIYQITAKLFDNYGNPVEIDNSTQINYQIAPESQAFASLVGGGVVMVNGGEAELSFRPKTLTGPVRIKAKAAGLLDGYIEVQTENVLEGRDFREIQPKILYGNLLGAGFGAVNKQDYFGGWFVFSGRTQAAASLITDPKPKQRLAEILPSGWIKLIDQNILELSFIGANQNSGAVNRLVVTDILNQKEILESFVVLKPQSVLKILAGESELDASRESINVINTSGSEVRAGGFRAAGDEGAQGDYRVETNGERVIVTKAGVAKVMIAKNGNMTVLDGNFVIEPSAEPVKNLISLSVRDISTEIVKVVIATGNLGNVVMVDEDFEFNEGVAPGVYLRQVSRVPMRNLETAFSGNSSVAPQGYFYTNTAEELTSSQAPGLNYLSLESADKADGVGFTGDNKNVLLFAAGNTVGEANLPYASDGGVVLGDPTIQIDNKRDPDQPSNANLMYDNTGYTKDIGKQILADTRNVKNISEIDYDNDGDKDLFVAYENGDVRLLENLNRGESFEDRGVFLTFANGFLSSTVLDINDDGWEDLVVATADSCKIGEVCVDAYLNNKTNFVRKNLNLIGYSAKNKIYQLKSADLNNDGFEDLVVSDDSGTIKSFYNHKGVVNRQGLVIGNLGASIDQNKNLKNEIVVYYPGMTGNNPASFDDLFFEEFTLSSSSSSFSQDVQNQLTDLYNQNSDNFNFSVQDQPQKVKLQFKNLSIDTIIGTNSVKIAKDMTAPVSSLAEQDEVLYTLTLRNSSGTNIGGLMVADFIPGQVKISKDSIKCLDCQNEVEILESGMSLRPYIVSNIDLPAGGVRTITYTGTVGKLPKVKIEVGQDLSSAVPVNDDLADISATPENNPTGRMVYYYSVSKNNATGVVSYGKYVTPDPAPPAVSDPVDNYEPLKTPEGKPVGFDLSTLSVTDPDSGIPPALEFLMNFGYLPGQKPGTPDGQESSGDSISEIPGVGAAYDDLGAALDDAAEGLEGAINMLTCAGGCLPMPVNFAFLAPGAINAMGIVAGYDPGTPIFGWGVPSIVPVCTGQMCYASLGGRLYLSPTLTAKIAMATCLGPYPTGLCYPFVLPIDITAGLCDAINGAVDEAMAGANNMISGVNGSVGMVNDGSVEGAPQDGQEYTGGFTASEDLGSYSMSASASTNMRVPGFPSVLTNWLDAQQSEIISKLSDLPDIYVLYPDVLSFVDDVGDSFDNLASGKKNVEGQPATPKGLRDILVDLNKIPFVQIEPREVILKIPSLTPAEIDKFLNDAKQWVKDEEVELDRIMGVWKCGPFAETVPDPNGGTNADGTPRMVPGYYDVDGTIVYGDRPWKTICDTVVVDFSNLIESIEKNIQAVEGYKQLPRQILAWRTMFTKYVIQVICYIDTIINFFVGNVAKWMDQIYGWVDAYYTLKEMVMTWKALFDLVIEYQASCDKCTSARFTLLELILKLFAFIPSPPVIPFPKMPDLYMDFSQIQAGVKLVWPDIKFRPEKIILPTLPRIYFPDLPTLTVVIPEIPVLPDLSLSFPELPDLPQLNLPVLPDLPPPPKIPEFPAAIKATISILQKIFKIVCLIKKGLIPVPEASLKGSIESMTERGLSPLLPIDLGLSLQWPEISYDFPRRIVLTTKVNLQFDFEPLYTLVKTAADGLNGMTTNFVDIGNKFLEFQESILNQVAGGVNQAMEDAVPDDVTVGGETSGPQASLLNSISLPDEIIQTLNSDAYLKKEFAMFAPSLGESVAGLSTISKELEAEKKRMEKIIAEDFQDVKLAASNITLNSNNPLLNRSIEDLDAVDVNGQLAKLGSEFGETRKLAGLRENLLAYVKDQNTVYDKLEGSEDLNGFATMIAQVDGLEDTLVKAGYAEKRIIADNGVVEGGEKLYAAIPSLSDALANSGLDSSRQNKPIVKGVFVYNENEQQNSKVLNYEGELSLPSTINFIDSDGDNDEDLLLSFGGNIYLKENYKNNGSVPVYYGGQPLVKEILDYIPAAGSVKGFVSSFDGNSQVEMEWVPVVSERLMGYEIIYGRTLGGILSGLNTAGLNKLVYLADGERVFGEVTLAEGEVRPQILPDSRIYNLSAEAIQGEVLFDGPEQLVLAAGGQRVKVEGNMSIYTTAGADMRMFVGGADQGVVKLQPKELMEFSSGFAANLEIQVSSGSVVLINENKVVGGQKLFSGAKIELDLKYQSANNGSALIRLPGDGYTRVDAGQSLVINTLEDPTETRVTVEIDNGFYYATIRSFDQTGFRSTSSPSIVLAPNICADRQTPMAIGGPSTREVAIFKKLEIDATKSFDVFGQIVSYYLDTDLTVDSNNDGNPTNDKNLGRDLNITLDTDGDGVVNNDLSDPRLFVGPYKDLSERKVMLNVIDQTGNIGQQEITIKVYVPAITLSEESATPGEIKGAVDPEEGEIPVSILRDRMGVIEQLKTSSASPNGKYYTNADGEFVIEDLNLDDTVVVKNSAGEIIAEIDPLTGRIILKNPLYKLEARPAEEPLLPTRIVILDALNEVIATVFVVSDGNIDVTMQPADFVFNVGTVAILDGVHIKELNNLNGSLEFRKIAGDDARYPGGVEIIEKASLRRLAVLDSAGNFYVYDPRLKLNLKPTSDLRDPMIFEVIYQENEQAALTVIAEFFIDFNNQNPLEILSGEKFKSFTNDPRLAGTLLDTDQDGMPDLWELQYGFNPDSPADAVEDPDEDELTNLEEFRAGTNPLLADTDGDGFNDGFELKLGSSPKEVALSPFSDVTRDNPYFDDILEFVLRGILEGIPSGNQSRFGVDEPIKRAEFAKVMLDIFCIIPRPEAYTGPSAFYDIQYVEGQLPWYYAATKEAYFQGFITGYRGLIDTVTGRTPFAPEETINKAETVKIILEALERQGIIDMSDVVETEVYYEVYMQIAQNLQPYLVPGKTVKSNFIITADEAANPEAPLKRGEFIAMASRVLEANNCADIDSDNDGMPDYWERLNGLNVGLNDADLDPDKDLLVNIDEYKFGTDPQDRDTDKGGIFDGEEVRRGTNPLDLLDDYEDWDRDGLSNSAEVNNYKTDPRDPDTDDGGVPDGIEVGRGTDPLDPSDDLIDPRNDLDPGLYVIQEACTICPCKSAVDHTADLIPGDKILAVISDENNSKIFSQSNLVTVVEIRK